MTCIIRKLWPMWFFETMFSGAYIFFNAAASIKGKKTASKVPEGRQYSGVWGAPPLSIASSWLWGPKAACFNGAMMWVGLKVVHSKGCTVVWGGVGAEPVLGRISPAEVLKPAGTRQGIIPSVGGGW